MIELNITFFIQLVNFLIILAVLNLILYRPIRGVLKKRAEHTRLYLDDIENFLRLADERLLNYEHELDNVRTEGADLRQQLKEQGFVEERRIVARATEAAAEQLQETRDDVAGQKKTVLSALEKDIKKYAQSAVGKILSPA